ncbi:hypothetical protein NDU88_006259 [Pleurodeles waltl]|uniref:Uncharacterized protein n=1 Tax=Pleurodeles waltl TaxID=8319 RepID=A0AAV7X093_PLEWA|nr:hypothetical protein NDU88_006259 [Pleurodeles waltl]
MKKGLERARERAVAVINGPDRAKAQAVAMKKQPERTRAQAVAIKKGPETARAQAVAMKNGPERARAQAVALKNGPERARAQAVAMKNGPERARAQAVAMKNGPERARAQAVPMKNGPDKGRAQAAAMKNGPERARAQAAAMKRAPGEMRDRGVAMKKGHGMATQHVSKHSSHITNNHRKKKRKKCILLTIIVIVSCVMFAGSGVLIAIGYLNPGPIGLGILAGGSVLYFLTVIFLACCCICTDKKYPGRYSQSIIGRFRGRTGNPAVSLINPPARGRPQVQPPKSAAGNKGQVGPNHPKDQQAQIPTPKGIHSVDQTIIAVPSNVSDGISSTDASPETQERDTNSQIPQTNDITIITTEDPPVDVRIVSSSKIEKNPQEKDPADAISEGNNISHFADPSNDASIISTPRREQEQKSSVFEDTVNMNIASIADPSVDTKIVVTAKQGHGPQEKTDTSCCASETFNTSSPYPDANLIIIPQDTKNQHQEEKTVTHLNSLDSSTGSVSGPLIDVRIVSNTPVAESLQENTRVGAGCENIITSSIADQSNNVMSALHYKQDTEYLENTVSSQHSGKLTTISSPEPHVGVRFESHHKLNQDCNEPSATAPSHGEFMLPGATSTTDVLVPSHHKEEK